MTDRFAVSALLPLKGASDFAVPAIESILCQSFSNFELIIVDDGIAPPCLDYIRTKALMDSRIRLIRNPGSGIVSALNFGIAVANGSLIARMDGDDVAYKERLTLQLQILDQRPDVALIGSQVRYIDAAGVPTGATSNFPLTHEAIDVALMTKGCVVSHPTAIFRKDAVLSVGGYRQALLYAEDLDLWLRLSEKFSVINVPDILLDYRLHGDQISQQRQFDQSLAHALAVALAKDRRRGAPAVNLDQDTSITEFEKLVAHHSGIQTLFRVYSTLSAALEGHRLAPFDELAALFHYLARTGAHISKKKRIEWMSTMLDLNRSNLSLRQTLSLINLALRVSPGRLVKSLLL